MGVEAAQREREPAVWLGSRHDGGWPSPVSFLAASVGNARAGVGAIQVDMAVVMMSTSLVPLSAVCCSWSRSTDIVPASDTGPKPVPALHLETTPLAAIREGKCNNAGRAPPIFCVGQLLAAQDRDTAGEHSCLKWLDKQPSKSVVYICFGSLGLVSASQLKEIAEGLERSGHRFLWVVRSPPPEDKSKTFLPPSEPDLDALLPPGFVDRTRERGMVVKGWAPQVAVLSHVAVGGLVTHCGWNSALEAVWEGVPMATWPLYAEQHFNRVVMVEGLGVAVGVEEGKGGLVAAEEVERGVRELMEGVSVRKVLEEKRKEARAAMEEGGESVAAMGKLIDLWKS
ncbi:anthocyanidin 5,3-O-glucosyltransferase-like [Salvia splendens]|uniref:anthocyanidin 5,3-O-glucosyltransferase-like n=1 Tax=Salvia splendens TaxID=180675 RepID=UPI001C25856E|nr:anthocyanidin 5,3-O-glucosyltransferase-like [Salvia splendens]